MPNVEIVNDIYGVWMSPIVDGEPDHENAIHVELPTDSRSVAAVEYTRTDDSLYHIFIFDGEVMASAYAYKALVIPFYKDFNPIADDRKLDFIYNRFGLGGKDEDGDSLKDSMANSADLKHAFISYSLSRDDDLFGHWVDMLYGNIDGECPDNSNSCTLARVDITGEYEIYYRLESGYIDDLGYEVEGGYKITVERESKDADEGYYYIIPVGFLKEQILPDKFKAYERMFNMFMYAEKKVKMKWYQSMFFRFIFFIVALVVAVAVGAISITQAITAAVMQVVNTVISQIDPRLAAILGLAFALYNMPAGAGFKDIFNVANKMIQTFYQFQLHAIQGQIESIAGEIQTIGEETKEMKEEIAEMWKQGIYVPLETLDYMTDTTTPDTFIELMTNPMDMIDMQQENLLNPYATLVR